MIHKECVEEEGWVSEETFKKTLAVYQVLPGPEAHELCVYFGRLRGGRLGAFLAGLGFMLPGFILMLGLSILYVEAGLNEKFEELFYGLQAAVGALVAMAIVRLSRKFIDDVPLALIAVAAFALTVFASLSFVPVLLLAGATYWLVSRAEEWRASGSTPAFDPSPAALAVLAIGAITLPLTAEIFIEGLKTGLLTFGGAYTAIPFLQESAVEGKGWLTEAQFIDGIAIAGVLPAPVIIFSTFVGYVAGGIWGALAITLGVFLPAFIFPIYFHRALVSVAESHALRPFLLGVAAGVIGLIGAVTITLLDVGVVDVPSGIIAALAFVALYRFQTKLAVLWVVGACGIAGVLLQATVL